MIDDKVQYYVSCAPRAHEFVEGIMHLNPGGNSVINSYIFRTYYPVRYTWRYYQLIRSVFIMK